MSAENIIFATHYPITNVPGAYFLRQHQERSYAIALEGQKELGGMYYGIDEDGLSLRSDGDRLLLGAAQIISDQICGTADDNKNIFTPQRIYFRAGIKNLLIDMGESVSGLTKGLFASKRCRHMGCKLDWNSEESSWECSCHGSAYYEDGRLKDNPAQTDLK